MNINVKLDTKIKVFLTLELDEDQAADLMSRAGSMPSPTVNSGIWAELYHALEDAGVPEKFWYNIKCEESKSRYTSK